jgi:hypothetical protein
VQSILLIQLLVRDPCILKKQILPKTDFGKIHQCQFSYTIQRLVLFFYSYVRVHSEFLVRQDPRILALDNFVILYVKPSM